MVRVLGLDPGLAITGYGLVELAPGTTEPRLVEAGVIRPAAGRAARGEGALERRLARLYSELDQLLRELKPDQVALEKLYAHYRHPRTAILMAHARGAILLCLSQHGLPVEHLPATEVKKAVTGYGHASKEQIQRAVAAQCGLKELPSPPDVADAIAIALTHARRLAGR